MKITVLNGSPQGNNSITMQYVNYMQMNYPEYEINIVNISQRIKKIEQDEDTLKGIIDHIKDSDAVLWAFPVYVYLVPAAYKRFIELIWERKLEGVFNGKYTAALSTSIHFYDSTAHNYVHGIADDLNMKYIGFFSAEMKDLLKDEERKKFDFFVKDFFDIVERKIPTARKYKPLNYSVPNYKPGNLGKKIDIKNKKVLIISDSTGNESNLGRMVERFRNSLVGSVELVNLNEVKINGGCLGCMKCALDNKCVYGDTDSIKELYNDKIKNADIIIYAGKIVDRYFSARWKMFMERRFMNTHQPQMVGKQFGIFISGPLGSIPNLPEILEADAEISGANLAGIISDEYEDSRELDLLIDSFAERIVNMAENKYVRPITFPGIGGMKVFRDEIWGKLRLPFQGDHNYYKQHGVYDFPQKDWKVRIFNMFMIPFSKIPKVRENIRSNMRGSALKPFQKYLDSIDKEK